MAVVIGTWLSDGNAFAVIYRRGYSQVHTAKAVKLVEIHLRIVRMSLILLCGWSCYVSPVSA